MRMWSSLASDNTKHISLFGPAAVKQWKNKVRRQDVWRCYECQYPKCVKCAASGKDTRPMYAVPHNALVDGQYYCLDCRYPPCKCGARRQNPGGRNRFKEYTCDRCANEAYCKWCQIQKPKQDFNVRECWHALPICRECQDAECYNCKKRFVLGDDGTTIPKDDTRPDYLYCSNGNPSCRYPKCAKPRCQENRPNRNLPYHVKAEWCCKCHRK